MNRIISTNEFIFQKLDFGNFKSFPNLPDIKFSTDMKRKEDKSDDMRRMRVQFIHCISF